MIKNRTAQLIYQTIYCTLGFIGIIASLGIFDNISNVRWDFYVHFTNISNFFCIGVMVVALIQTAKKKEDSYVTAAPLFKFIGMLGICDFGKAVLRHIFTVIELFKSGLSVEIIVIVAVNKIHGNSK